MLTIKAMTGGVTYAAHHLSNNDYYSVGERVTGQWLGRGAELLGLEGAVTMEQFEAIRQGIHPETGEFLRQRQSADRFNDIGEKTGTARNLYDFTISAPKALSIQALEDPRLLHSHNIAIVETAKEMESLAAARIRRLGANDNRVTSNLVIARYDHDTSRELDPQIHTHLVAANLTYDGAEGRWKALQASDIYAQREYLSEVYRNALAREVMKLGYTVQDRSMNGKDLGIGIAGIEEATLEKFSRRSAQRDQAIAEFASQHGRRPTNNEIARLVRDTRDPKLTEITTPEVKAAQYDRMTGTERQALQALHVAALERGAIHSPTSAHIPINYAREHLFERVSVAKEYELKTEALRYARGHVELAELKAALSQDIATGALLSARGELATQDSLARERRMVERIDQGIGRYQSLGRPDFVSSERLRSEQKQAIRFVLDSRDLAVNLRGAAGSGKTDTLQELQRGLTESRRSVVAVAPTSSAVDELRKVGFKQATTIARLLADPKHQQELAGQVLIVDEAGMVASKDMAMLLDLSERHGARIVFSGDTAQIKSVSEGDALRVLERESKLQSVSLLQVQRQTVAEYRQAVEALRSSPALGFRKLDTMGAIREVDWRLKAQEVSLAYRQAVMQPNAKGHARSVLVVAGTHEEIRAVTHAIRNDLKAAGELGDGQSFIRHEPLNWTDAQKRHAKNYSAGLILEFHEATKGVRRHESVEVVAADKTGITARKQDGSSVKLAPNQSRSFGVFARQDIEIAAGDKLLLQANRRGKEFRATNGELVTVASVDADTIVLEDGRLLPANYRQLAHGYAVTAHRSQGKTVDIEIIAADRMPQDLFYVSVSRGREGVTVITTDKAELEEAITVSGDRQSATELARQAALPEIHQSPERERESAQSWAIRHKAASERLSVASHELQHGFERESLPKQTEYRQEKVIDHSYSISL
jgi:conjugative relaxase-like TrwC/TraI family protein